MEPNRDQQRSDDSARAPWAAHAAKWSRLGPPLRPCPEDLMRLHEAWMTSLPDGMPGRRVGILSLGVTPEIASFPWAPDAKLTAIDASDEMIRTVWPGDGPGRKAVRGDWLQTPFADASFDLVLCDAGLAPLVGGDRLTVLGGELRRLLREEGRVVMRHFARPAQPESEDNILRATESGCVQNFHEFKLRLLMALESKTPATGVRLGDAWEEFARLFPDRALLAGRLGCDLETIATIDAYRGRDARYTFPSLAEVAGAFDAFRLTPGPPGRYPLAECCPVFALTPKP